MLGNQEREEFLGSAFDCGLVGTIPLLQKPAGYRNQRVSPLAHVDLDAQTRFAIAPALPGGAIAVGAHQPVTVL
jgi:hypothetical protein